MDVCNVVEASVFVLLIVKNKQSRKPLALNRSETEGIKSKCLQERILVFTCDDISSLPVPDAKFQEAKSLFMTVNCNSRNGS